MMKWDYNSDEDHICPIHATKPQQWCMTVDKAGLNGTQACKNEELLKFWVELAAKQRGSL